MRTPEGRDRSRHLPHRARRELQREGADLKVAMWSLRGNTWNLSEERQEQRKNLCRQYTKLAAR